MLKIRQVLISYLQFNFSMTYLLTWNQETELNRIQASDLEVKLNNFHADSNDDINLSNTDELLDK